MTARPSEPEPLAAVYLLLVLVLCLGERDLLHRIALSDGGGIVRFYPVGSDQAAAAGFVQRFPSVIICHMSNNYINSTIWLLGICYALAPADQ